MVVRCSNGVGFIVLEPEPSIRTGISVEVYEAANPDNLIDVLPDSFGRKWTDPRKGTGAGEFKVYASNPHVRDNPDILKAGNIVRLLLDRVPRFAFKIESRELVQIGEGDDSAIAWHIKGRGALSLLEDGQIYPAGGLTGSPERPFEDVTPGSAMLTLLGEARARSSSILSQITDGFTATEDANNIPYDRTINLDERAGTDLLRVADRIVELAADVYMTPILELRIVNDRGIDRTIQTEDVGPVVLQQGANIRELSRSEDAVIRNALLIETPGGFVERIEAASVSTYRRREAFISLGNITDTTQIDRAAEAVFERSANPAEAISISITDADGRRPYVDWSVGDWILAPDIEGNLERFRVASLTITEHEETGQIEAIPELATLTDDLEERLSKWLKSMARGTMGGTAAEVTEPNRAPAEVIEAVDEGVDTHEATFLHPDELADLADTDVTGLADDDILRYHAAGGAWQPEALNLDALEDVDLTTIAPTNGQVLKYDSSAGIWKPANESGGGGGGGVYNTWSAVDTPPAIADPMDDEFDDDSFDSGLWSDLNIGTVTKDESDHSLVLVSDENANQVRGIYQAAPAGDWTIRGKVTKPNWAGTRNSFLFVAKSTTERLYWVGFWESNARTIQHASPTDVAGSWGSEIGGIGNFLYVEIAWDDTAETLTMRYSMDGVAWSRNFASSLEAGWTPGIVGLGITNRTGGLVTHGFDWFRRTQ